MQTKCYHLAGQLLTSVVSNVFVDNVFAIVSVKETVSGIDRIPVAAFVMGLLIIVFIAVSIVMGLNAASIQSCYSA